MKKILIFISIILAIAISTDAQAAKARVGGLKVTTAPEALSLSFSVENAFPEGIEDAIKSGVPTSFNFLVEFTRRRRLWFDKDMGSWNFKHTVKYDTLKQEYEITLEEKGFLKVITKDYEEMKKLMSSPDSVVLLPSWGLPRGYGYELHIMAELRTIRLPFRLDYMFFFLRLWDIDTDWYSYKFTY